MVTRLEIATREGFRDPRGEQVARQVRSFLGISIASVRTCEVYRIDAEFAPGEAERVLQELVDPVRERGAIGRLEHACPAAVVAVGYKPGVTDPVGKSAKVAIEDTLARPLGDAAAVYSSRLYLLDGVSLDDARRLATELLANPVIQTVEVVPGETWRAAPPDLSVPRVAAHATPPVRTVDLSGDDAALARISREGLLALSLDEMHAVRDHFRAEEAAGRHPTDVELECLAQTWSEHCKHKIFNATIDYEEPGRPVETIHSLFDTCIKATTREIDARAREETGRTWLVSVFHDNAGVVTCDEQVHLVYKVETHNSPSALDPYGGAITGIVGVNRDPFGTGLGADLLANVWGYCFASPFQDGALPKGLLHPRRVRDGVHEGVIDGGNQSGIPYGRGFELFDARFLGKPLVFCGTVGALPVTIAGRPGERKAAKPGDLIVMTGGRIGADGIHGATFSSAALDESAPVQAVQIGDPITQKRMFDFLLEARDLGLYDAITDNGAGGLSSSVGEMARDSGGARLDLARAPLKYAGLAPWEILVSEAQERMTLAVPEDRIARFLDLARRREVEATVVGAFTGDGVFHVTYGEKTVGRIPMSFLHEGCPTMRLRARWDPPRHDEPPPEVRIGGAASGEALLALLGRTNLASNEVKARRYDHEVKGLSIVKPWVGARADVPSEATVMLVRHGSWRGFVLSEGINPFYSDIDTHAMARSVVDLAVRRQLCAGARLDRIALLDNFCWPDPVASDATPDGRYKLAQLVRACRGLREACLDYGTPLVSGKDSMKNDSTMGGVKISVPPTLLVSAIGQIDDVRRALTLEPQEAGEAIFLLGTTGDELGGSEYFRWLGERAGRTAPLGEPAPWVGNAVPRLETRTTLPLYRAVERAAQAGLARSIATPAMGGIAVTLARMALAGELGLEIDLDGSADLAALATDVALFSESNGRFVLTCADRDAPGLEALFQGLACRRVGRVIAERVLRIRHGGRPVVDLGLDALRRAFQETFADA